MNRLKLWLFALLVVGAAALSLHAVTGELKSRAIQVLDARLTAASSRLAAAQRALQAEAGGVAALAARDPAVLAEIAGDEASAHGRKALRAASAALGADAEPGRDVASAAMASAEAELGVKLPPGARLLAAGRVVVERGALEPPADADVLALMREALAGKAQRGLARVNGRPSMAVVVPAGVGVLAVLVPLDASWVGSVASGSGVDVTVAVPGLEPISSTRAAVAAALVKAATASPGALRDAGTLDPVPLEVLGVPLGRVRLLFASAPANRVIALPLAPNGAGHVVLSAATQPLLAPVVRLQWFGIAGLAAMLILGLVFVVLLRPTEAPLAIPGQLVAAADRIGKGDYSARAPALAGKLGTLASALNRAAEAAEAGAVTGPSLLGREPLPETAEPDDFHIPRRPFTPLAVPPAPEPLPPPALQALDPGPAPTLRLDAAGLAGAAFEAAPVPSAFRLAPAAAPAVAPAPPPVPGPRATPAPASAGAPPAAPEPLAADGDGDDEEHWREVFREFLRVRGECGEPTQGLTYERFRAKLDANRASLKAKYGCRTVRFQVHLKDGKAALKATPIR